jgi:hypothetical protein
MLPSADAIADWSPELYALMSAPILTPVIIVTEIIRQRQHITVYSFKLSFEIPHIVQDHIKINEIRNVISAAVPIVINSTFSVLKSMSPMVFSCVLSISAKNTPASLGGEMNWRLF